jgi:tRNA nucleotidyltransferase (CCA-adding enzyme)
MSDYNFLMESRLSPQQMQVLSQVSRVASAQGLNLYLVGGAVRDLTLGQQRVRDLNFVVEGNPQRILRSLDSARPSSTARGNGNTPGEDHAWPKVERVAFDKRLNAAEIHFSTGVRAQIAASRNEVYSKLGRPPEIRPAMIFDDLKRRDFSANAMAVSLHPNSRGLLLDPTNGAADIARREFRVLHSRSFVEDPSRLYRLIRLGLRLDFKPEERTATLLGSAIEYRYWEQLTPEQQGAELRAILHEENPGRVLKALSDRGLLAALDSKLQSARIPYERFTKIRSAVRAVPGADPLLLNFYCLVEKLGSAQQSRLAHKVLSDRQTIKSALDLERAARQLARLLSSAKASRPSQVYALLSRYPKHLLLFLLLHYPQVKIQSRLKSYLFKFPQVRARLPRAELQAMGLPPGPKFEEVMERVFLDQLDAKIRTQPQLLKALRALSGIKEPPPKPAVPPRGSRPAARKAGARA